MAEVQATGAPVFFRNRELRFIAWFYCTTIIRSSKITEMLNTHFGTGFTPGDVRQIVNKLKRCRPVRKRFEVPKENWICLRHFGIHCFDYQRPDEELMLARYYFFGTQDELRCCSQEAVTSGSDSDRASGEFPDPYPTRATPIQETSSTAAIILEAIRTRKLLIPLALTATLLASLASIYFCNLIRLSIRHQRPSIKDDIIEITLEHYHHLVSLKTHLQTNLDRPNLFLLYCFLFVLLLDKTNTCLSSLSPITLQPLNPPPTTTTLNGPASYRRWLSNHFPYFFLRNPTPHHRSLTLSNFLVIPKSFLHDAFHTTILFIFFYFGWLTSKLICPHIHTVESTHVYGKGIFIGLFSFSRRCPLPDLRLRECARAGVMFMVCRYTFMVFFWVVTAIPDVIERFQVGYRGE